MRTTAAPLALTLQAVFAVATGAACAPATSQGGSTAAPQIKATAANVGGDLERAASDMLAGTIWVENRSTERVTVFSVTLHHCDNIAHACDAPVPLDLVLEPGDRRSLLTVRRQSNGQPYTLTYTFEWAGPNGRKMPGAQAAEPDLILEDVEKLRDKIVLLRAIPDSVVVKRGTTLLASQLRVLAFGRQHELLGRYRGNFSFNISAPFGMVKLTPPDTLATLRTGRGELTLTADPPPGAHWTFAPVKIKLIVQ